MDRGLPLLVSSGVTPDTSGEPAGVLEGGEMDAQAALCF